MKKLIQNIPFKGLLWGIIGTACLLLFAGIILVEHQLQKALYDQQMAERWSKEGDAAQISCFFGQDVVTDAAYFKGVEQNVDKTLLEASIVTENENARLWIDAVSQEGKVNLSSSRASVQLNAIGVMGEFFQFHPVKLLAGSLFHENSMMQDGIVIDEETAWQLFGSSDVAGMQVMIGQVPHYITGVIERQTGRIQEAAGLEQSVCYLSLESLQKYGSVTGGFFYEIVMPNPIKGFAYSTISTAVAAENTEVVVVENSSRYQLLSLFNILKSFGIRSMSQKGIVYPYWENVARGYEDIFVLTLLAKTVLLIIPCILCVVLIIYLWKKRTWTWSTIWQWISDKIYESGVKRQKKRKKKEEDYEEKQIT